MMALRIFIAYTLIISGLFLKPVDSYAQLARDTYTGYSADIVTEREIEFLISFKSYILAIIHLQSSRIRHNLRCLGYDGYANEYLEKIENEDLKNLLFQTFEDYVEDDHCDTFLNKTVPELYNSYRTMKVNLALHRAQPVDLGTSESVIRSVMSNKIGFDPVLCTLDNDDDSDEESQACFQRLRGIYNQRNLTNCDRIEVPYMYGDTSFCFAHLSTIANIKPDHPMTRISIGPLDALFSSNELPRLKEFNPLSFDELDEAVYTFNDKYTNNPYLGELANRISSEDGHLLRLEDFEFTYSDFDKLNFAKYLTAKSHQSPSLHLVTNYAEGSAPWLYSQELIKFPVLAFYKPDVGYLDDERKECLESGSRNLECSKEEFEEYGISLLCNNHKDFVNNLNHGSNLCDLHNNARLAEAYKSSLDLNSKLIEKFKSDDFETDKFRDESIGRSYKSVDLEWVKLLELTAALNSFHQEEINAPYAGHDNRFLDRLASRQKRVLGLAIGGTIGLSILCGFLSGGLLVVGCLAAAGIGANLVFYRDSLKSYEMVFQEFFANPGSDDEESLTLVEFESFKAERQALLMEVAFVGVGLSIKDIFSRSVRIIKNLNNIENTAAAVVKEAKVEE